MRRIRVQSCISDLINYEGLVTMGAMYLIHIHVILMF
jgi:hypothetical protein